MGCVVSADEFAGVSDADLAATVNARALIVAIGTLDNGTPSSRSVESFADAWYEVQRREDTAK